MFHSNMTSENKSEKVKKDGNSVWIYANFKLKAKQQSWGLKKKVDYLPDPGSLSLPGLKSQQEECKMGGLGFGFLSFPFLFPF